LLSSDKNLAVKALVHRINVYAPRITPHEFLAYLSVHFQTPTTPGDVDMTDANEPATHQHRLRLITEQLFDLISTRFPPAMHRHFSRCLGDVYTVMVPAEPWSVGDMTRMMQKHWISVFCECFPRRSDSQEAQNALGILDRMARVKSTSNNEWTRGDVLKAVKATQVLFAITTASEPLNDRIHRDSLFLDWLRFLQ
jgi:hypothetical protein